MSFIAFKCAVGNCYESSYKSHAVCFKHLVMQVVLFGATSLAIVTAAIHAALRIW
jgi:hypothetical protein